ncbi:MAG: type I asparaginase [Bacteroidales bacterium]|nr:type I asparaginase [Bacteroidales bacterium]
MDTSILLIYTGGTIGMKVDPQTQALAPFDFSHIMEEVPELKKFGYKLDSYSFDPAIDSSDANIHFWQELAKIIETNYNSYDGFVVLHGTDTMSYTASALSFMLENLGKPVIFTGSQLPIGLLRTDGKEYLISSIEIAAAKDEDDRARVPEVCVYFESQLYRGNRTTKYSAENFRAFRSANYPVLADVGIHIRFNQELIRYPKWGKEFKVHYDLDSNVAIVKIVPGMNVRNITVLSQVEGMRAIILETFGSGNAPTNADFLNAVKEVVDKGILVVNVTQCNAGKVDMDAYATGIALKQIGVISGEDSTMEAALAKLYFLMGKYPDNKDVAAAMEKNIRGEISKL